MCTRTTLTLRVHSSCSSRSLMILVECVNECTKMHWLPHESAHALYRYSAHKDEGIVHALGWMSVH